MAEQSLNQKFEAGYYNDYDPLFGFDDYFIDHNYFQSAHDSLGEFHDYFGNNGQMKEALFPPEMELAAMHHRRTEETSKEKGRFYY